MVVAVVAVRMVQVAVDEIVDMIAMRHRFMAAPGSVHMARLVAAAVSRALIRIGRVNFEPVFVYVIAVRVMQVAVMQIIDMVAMLDRGVTAIRPVLMVVMRVVWFVTGAHDDSPRVH